MTCESYSIRRWKFRLKARAVKLSLDPNEKFGFFFFFLELRYIKTILALTSGGVSETWLQSLRLAYPLA